MQIWTVANQKGGVGKTTTTVALAGLLAEQNKRVLMMDIDPHGSLSSYFGADPDHANYSTFTLFTEYKNLSLDLMRRVIQKTQFSNLHFISSSTALATLERRAIGQDGMGLVVRRALALVAKDYDYVLIDCPPLLGVLMINALAACEFLFIPTQTEFLAIKGLERMVHTLEMMKKSGRPMPNYLIVPTMFDRRTQASNSSLLSMRQKFGDNVWPGKIPVDTKLRDASKAGVPPSMFAPNSRASEAYRALLHWQQRKVSDEINVGHGNG